MKYFRAIFLPILIILFWFGLARSANAASISSISTNTISPGSTQLVISGSGFGPPTFGDMVCFNETIISYFASPCVEYFDSNMVSWGDTSITLNVPSDPSGYMQGGYLNVYVGYSPASTLPLYNIQPVISSTDYTTVVTGMEVAVTGQYFTDMFGVTAADNYTVKAFFNGVQGVVKNGSWTKTGLVATVPSGATSGNLSLVFTLQSSDATITVTGPVLNVLQPITSDTYSAFQQYLNQVNVPRAWGVVGGGRTPIVAVIDDGVYINHPDLAGRIWKNGKEVIGNGKDDDKNGYKDDIYGWDFVSNEGEMTVRGTHGTLVAGIIAANKNNSEGISGIAPGVKIMPLIVCDDRIGCPTDLIAKAIFYAVDNGATVVNLSLGSQATTGYSTGFNKAVKYAYDHGVVVIAAAGNGDIESGRGQDLNFIPQSPVCNDISRNAVIGVGAVDNNNFLTPWSNTGTKCVDAFAPGVNIISTSVPKFSNLGGYYDNSKSGTSFSAPIVTGIVALLRQKFPYMPVKEVVDRITNSRNTGGVIDAYQVLSSSYKPPTISAIDKSTIRANRLIGQRIKTITGRGFSKGTAITILTTKARVKYINSTRLVATFSLNQLTYGNNLVTVSGGGKPRSIFRWIKITK